MRRSTRYSKTALEWDRTTPFHHPNPTTNGTTHWSRRCEFQRTQSSDLARHSKSVRFLLIRSQSCRKANMHPLTSCYQLLPNALIQRGLHVKGRIGNDKRRSGRRTITEGGRFPNTDPGRWCRAALRPDDGPPSYSSDLQTGSGAIYFRAEADPETRLERGFRLRNKRNCSFVNRRNRFRTCPARATCVLNGLSD